MSASAQSKTNHLLDALARHSFGRLAAAERFEGNAVDLLRDGAQAYPAWLDAIAGAERFIEFENYIFRDDRVGRDFSDALAEAARRGVKCRLLYDWLGCAVRTPDRFWRSLRAAGVEVRAYNPPRSRQPLPWGNRDHRKVLCVDGHIAFTGGLCVGREWMGWPDRGIAPWRDTGIAIRGPAAQALSRAFADSWREAGGGIGAEELPDPTAAQGPGKLPLWVLAGRPDGMGLYRVEQLVAEIAERSLWLADAYFVGTTGYVRALAGAAKAGVDVRLLVPGASDLPMVQTLSRAAYRPLLEAGVRVFEWNGSMMHAKTSVVDGLWSRIGSSNSNLASWMTNRELDVVIHDRGFAGEMEAMYEQDLGNATEILLRSGRVKQAPIEGQAKRRRSGRAGRLFAGAVGLGSVVGATLSRHRLLGASEARVIGAAGLFLLAVATLAVLAPRFVAGALAAGTGWVAVVLLGRAWRLYRDRRDEERKK